mgnify:CR=1 FL=1
MRKPSTHACANLLARPNPILSLGGREVTARYRAVPPSFARSNSTINASRGKPTHYRLATLVGGAFSTPSGAVHKSPCAKCFPSKRRRNRRTDSTVVRRSLYPEGNDGATNDARRIALANFRGDRVRRRRSSSSRRSLRRVPMNWLEPKKDDTLRVVCWSIIALGALIGLSRCCASLWGLL